MELEDVYKLYYPDVFRFLYVLCGKQDVAEELSRETFYKAIRSIHKFRGDCSMKSWLYQIGKNTYLTWRKKQRHLAGTELTESDLEKGWYGSQDREPENVEETVIRRNEAMRIYRALEHLSEPYKEVFCLRVLGELSFKEIGELYGKGEGWARVVYHRSKLKVQNILGEERQQS